MFKNDVFRLDSKVLNNYISFSLEFYMSLLLIPSGVDLWSTVFFLS